MEKHASFKIIVDESTVEKLAKDEVKRILEGVSEGSWWDLKRLEHETCRKRDWLKEKILLNPEFKEEMSYISNGCEGGQWMFRAAAMREFLDRYFDELNRSSRRRRGKVQ
ncbi:DUF771 domain-containing protein [Paenibacillus filicis]|uniref:DUF771 domain-containing protein n=1 Tax=Paenibacillus filicis TaxID=669464 RepID=A0ABU9DVN4_9BACL